MTTPAWPVSVTEYALDGSMSEGPENNLAEFKPEVGPAKRRRRTSVATDLVAFDQLLTFTEWEALLDFYADDLQDGALTFTRHHPRDIPGSTLEWQFMEPPKLKTSTYIFATVSIALRKMP